MDIRPIRVTDDGVLIPLEYLQNARECVYELHDDFVLTRPMSDKLPDLPLDASSQGSSVEDQQSDL